MHYWSVMLELWTLLFVTSLLGRRLVDLLPNTMRLSIGFYVAPILGVALLVLITTAYGWLSPFRFVYSLPLTLLLCAFAFFYENKKRQLFREWVQVALFATVCSLPILAPIIYYGGYNPFTDIFTYIAQGQWLQTHAFSEKAIATGYYPYLTQIVAYQQAGSRMGGSFILGFVQSLFDIKWSYNAYIPAVSLAFVTGSLSLGGVIRQVVSIKRLIILALCLLPSFSLNGFVFGAEWGFYPQTYGLAFAAGLAAMLPFLTLLVVKNDFSWLRITIYTIPVAICSAALLFAYNEPFPIFAAGIFLFFIIVGICYFQRIKSLLVFISLYTIQLCLLMNYEAIRIARNLIQTISISHTKAAIGWPVLWSPVQFLAHAFGMKSPFKAGMYHSEFFISTYLFPLFFIGVCTGLFYLVRKYPRRYLAIYFLICIDFALFLAFIKFRYFALSGSSAEVGYTFLQFKVAKYAAPFSLALIGIFFAMLWRDMKTARRSFIVIYTIALVFGYYVHCRIVSPNFTNNFLDEVQKNKNPFDRLLQLRTAVSDVPVDDVIHVALGYQHSKLRQMVAYVLYDRKISSDYRDDGYILGHLPQKDGNMLPGKAGWLIASGSHQHLRPHDNQVGPFVIEKAPFGYVTIDSNDGGFATESNHKGDTWNWVGDSIDFHCASFARVNWVKFKFKLVAFPGKRSFIVDLKNKDGKEMYQTSLQVTKQEIFESPWVRVNTDHFILHVQADGQPIRLSQRDARKAKFEIENVVFDSK